MSAKEIVIISGKGGTGKTTITASLVPLFEGPVIADCDVDAPDLDILLAPERVSSKSISASRKAIIEPENCVGCGACFGICRFGALSRSEGVIRVEPIKCEGCGSCTLVCKADAIKIEDYHTGDLFQSKTIFGPMVHARLTPGGEVSGKLVAMVRSRAKEVALEGGHPFVLIDGPPGIACNVISSLTGADLAILVVEPTLSGIHDLERVYEITKKVRVSAAIVINKANLSSKNRQKIEGFAQSRGIPVIGQIPFDDRVRESTNRKKILSQICPEYPSPLFWPQIVEKIHDIL